MNLAQDLKFQFRHGSPVIKLVFINVISFVAIGLLRLILLLANTRFDFVHIYLALTNNFDHLFHTPWTIITYEFTHTGFLHLLFNMVMLFFTGRIFLDFFRQTDIWRVYIYGGIIGGVLYLLSGFLPVFNGHTSTLIGASGSVMAILFATAAYAPNLEVSLFGIFQLRLIWLAIGYLLLDLIAIPDGNAGGHIAHIGGAIFGYMFAKYRKGDIHLRIFESFFDNKPDEKKFNVKVNVQRTSKNNIRQSHSNHSPSQEDIDIILDKISKNGYDKLSKQEKDILFKASQD
jgi:membrane associated rhomboid family serine protease